MSYKHNPTLIERIAESLRIIPGLHDNQELEIDRITEPGKLTDYPPPDKWDRWEEYEAKGWAKKEKKSYGIVPTTCFNCESACGLLAYIDINTGSIRKFEGNPYHPGSRGRLCAKGPATINQITIPRSGLIWPLLITLQLQFPDTKASNSQTYWLYWKASDPLLQVLHLSSYPP